jgi:cell division transport system permease protein
MLWAAIDFVCREAALHLRRERLIAIATISTVAVLLLVLGAVVLFLLDVRVWTDEMSRALEVSAYFERDVPREKAEHIAEEISRWPAVRETEFVAKEEGWEWLKSQLASSTQLKDLENPLPDRVRVHVTSPSNVPDVAKQLEEVEGVKDVVPSAADATRRGSFSQRVVQARRAVAYAGIAVGILVALAGIFIVHNTIRLALHSRWREIYIMQLIGATRFLIAAPFLIEGMLQAALGAALACCILVPAHMYLRSLTARSAPFVFLAPDSSMLPFAVILLLAGALLGLTGSAISIRRYMSGRPEWHG